MVLTNLYFLVFQVSPNEISGCCNNTASNSGYIDKVADSQTHKTCKNQEPKPSGNLLCFNAMPLISCCSYCCYLVI